MDIIKEAMGDRAYFSPTASNSSRGANVCQVAMRKLASKDVSDAFSLNPVYLRVSQAERECLNKQEKE